VSVSIGELKRLAVLSPRVLLAQARFWSSQTVSDARHIFVVGAPRSGTTLLKTLLVAHPLVGGTDQESTGLFRLRDLRTYRLGELSDEEMQRLLRESRHDLIRLYDLVVAALLRRRSKARFTDKLTVRAFRLQYVARHFPQSLFVNIVRDGRDSYCSAVRHPNVPQSDDIRTFAKYWASCVRIPVQTVPAERLLNVRYEDLTSEPETHLRRIMEFCGLEFAPQQVDVACYSTTTSIKKLEVHQNLAKPINTSSQGRWRRDMSETEREAFCRIAGGVLAECGYDGELVSGELVSGRC
jgi:Sulfotransferase family